MTREPTGGRGERSLPVNLLLKGRLCLLVGAGRLAHRKCESLLAHGAEVHLVAPIAVPEVEELAEAGRVSFRRESYHSERLDETAPFLVYTATDDDVINRRVARDCATRRILCCSASSWEEGDFISPSTLEWGRGQVSITTEGAACRQARFMRRRLEKLLGGERELTVLGIDLRHVPVGDFERVRPDQESAEGIRDRLANLAGLEEFALLVTCNRVELYAWAHLDESLEKLALLILGLDDLSDRVYRIAGSEVTEHAVNLVAGHLSELTCETPIVNQWKDSFRRAFDRNEAGVHLQRLHDQALVIAKKVRSFHRGAQNGLPDLVARLVAGRRAKTGPRVLVLGAGAMGRDVGYRLLRDSGLEVTWANRTVERIPAGATCEKLSIDEALSGIDRFDQVVTVLGTADPVLRPVHVVGREAPIVLIDLGMPRNVDPEVTQIEGVEVLDLGHFRHAETDREALLDLTHTVMASGAGASPRG